MLIPVVGLHLTQEVTESLNLCFLPTRTTGQQNVGDEGSLVRDPAEGTATENSSGFAENVSEVNLPITGTQIRETSAPPHGQHRPERKHSSVSFATVETGSVS